jgi:hypothetical protein
VRGDVRLILRGSLEGGEGCAARAPISPQDWLVCLVDYLQGSVEPTSEIESRTFRPEWWASGSGGSNWRIGLVGYGWPPSVQTFTAANLATRPGQGDQHLGFCLAKCWNASFLPTVSSLLLPLCLASPQIRPCQSKHERSRA